MIPSSLIASFTQVRLVTRELERRQRNHADGGAITERETRPVPLRLLILCPIRFHVAPEEHIEDSFGTAPQMPRDLD